MSREHLQELGDGPRTIHDHLNSVDEISTQERNSNALAMKELKRELRRDLEDQAIYQYQCQQSTEDSLKRLAEQMSVLTETVKASQIENVKPMSL